MTDLYRYYDFEGNLLYIGVSLSAVARAVQHRQDKHWWGLVSTITVEKFRTRTEALDAERLAIGHERPLHNKAHQPKPPKPTPLEKWLQALDTAALELDLLIGAGVVSDNRSVAHQLTEARAPNPFHHWRKPEWGEQDVEKLLFHLSEEGAAWRLQRAVMPEFAGTQSSGGG